MGRKGVMGFLLGREVGRGWEFDGKGGKGVGCFFNDLWRYEALGVWGGNGVWDWYG